LQRSFSSNEDLRPESFSSYQGVYSYQKNLEQYTALKKKLLELELLPAQRSDYIDESVLKVLEGSYNGEIWLRKEREKRANK
jgi:hypothetical protein